MIDFDILDKMGSTKKRLRELFTSAAGSSDFTIRERIERDIESRIQEGMMFNMRNYRVYTMSDLAWDSQPILPELVPLMLYAQRRIDFKSVVKQLRDLSPDTLKKFADVDEKTKEIKSIDISKFTEVSVNLVRSYITRRTATLSVERTKLYPYLKYDPLSTSFVAKLRGDVLSQRVEMMTNQYGYRHELPQATREMLMYSHTVEFPEVAWDKQTQLRKKKRAKGMDTSQDSEFEVESFVVKEGVPFIRPHPTRVYWDNSHPLSSINTDTGCTYIGYWSVARFKDVEKNTDYFNRDNITYSHTNVTLLNANKPYFELYFPSAAINFPSAEASVDVAANNDREQNVGRYSGQDGDKAITLVEHRIKVVPKDIGVGDYPNPVWMRLVVAGTRTVVFAEFLPSLPAIYYGYNEDDSRLVNASWASEIVPWQDQMSNMLTQLLLIQKSSLVKVLCANIDLLTPEMLAEFRAIIKGERYVTGPMLLEFKGDQLSELGQNIDSVFKMLEAKMPDDITVIFKSIVQMMTIAERVLNVSAQELGQSASHELSATEVSELTNTTNVLTSYMGVGLDEGLAAKKKILYEALIAFGQDKIYVPVVNRYTDQTIKAAGFEPVKEADEGDTVENYSDGNGRTQTVTGNKLSLVYEYCFNSRDGQERASNAKTAEVLVNLLGQLINIPGLLQDLGKEKLYQFLNHVIRMSGAGVDMTFSMKEGESETLPSGNEESDNKKEIQDVIRQILQAIQDDRNRIMQLEQATGAVNPNSQSQPTAPAPAPAPASTTAPAMPAPVA